MGSVVVTVQYCNIMVVLPVASGSMDKTIWIWDVEKEVKVVKGHTGYVTYVVFSAQSLGCEFIHTHSRAFYRPQI
jgi:WD40 repeat protein